MADLKDYLGLGEDWYFGGPMGKFIWDYLLIGGQGVNDLRGKHGESFGNNLGAGATTAAGLMALLLGGMAAGGAFGGGATAGAAGGAGGAGAGAGAGGSAAGAGGGAAAAGGGGMGWETAALLGGQALGSLGGLVGANQGGQQLSINDIVNLLATEYKASPTNFSAALQQLVGQTAYGTGAGPDAIALELMTRQIESAAHPQLARKFQAKYQGINTMLAQLQQTPGDPKIQKRIDKEMAEINKILGKAGVGTVSLGDGKLSIALNDPSLQALVNKARVDSELILGNRLTGQQNLSKLAADFPMATQEGIDAATAQQRAMLEREIAERYQTETDRILADANTRGFNPAGVLGELEKQRTQDLSDAQMTATDRALQILGGKQDLATKSILGTNAALSPDAAIALTSALRGQQTPTTGQLAAAQLAATSAAGQSNQRGNAIADAGAGLGDALTLMALLSSKGPGAKNA